MELLDYLGTWVATWIHIVMKATLKDDTRPVAIYLSSRISRTSSNRQLALCAISDSSVVAVHQTGRAGRQFPALQERRLPTLDGLWIQPGLLCYRRTSMLAATRLLVRENCPTLYRNVLVGYHTRYRSWLKP